MKNFILLAMFISSSVFCFGQAQKVSLNELKQRYKFQFVVEAGWGLPQFPNIEVGMITYAEEMKTPVLICALEKGKPIATYGVIMGNDNGRYILYDLDGDGVFEYRTNTKDDYIPNWVLFKSTTLKRGDTKEFLKLCDEIYTGFNSVDGPKNMQTSIKKLADATNDSKVANRDLYYSLLSYTLYAERPDVSFNIIYNLQKETNERSKGKTSMLFFLYTGEIFGNMGQDELSLMSFRSLKEQDSNSIISEYYIARLEDKKNKSTNQIKVFTQKHPSFWTLKK